MNPMKKHQEDSYSSGVIYRGSVKISFSECEFEKWIFLQKSPERHKIRLQDTWNSCRKEEECVKNVQRRSFLEYESRIGKFLRLPPRCEGGVV